MPVVPNDVDRVPAMDHVRWLAEPPLLRSPTVLYAFTGWNDAGDAASTAVRTLIERWDATAVAEIDPEPFTDFATIRPHVRLNDGRRTIVWPKVGVWSASVPGGDVLLVLGPEPSLRWRLFCEQLVGVADAVRRADDDQPRRPAGRRSAHPRSPGHRHGERPRSDRSVRAAALAVRGSDRHRRRVARRPHQGRAVATSLWAAVPATPPRCRRRRRRWRLLERACAHDRHPRPDATRWRARPPSTTPASRR